MAVLGQSDLVLAERSFVDEMNLLRESTGLLKSDVVAAVAAADSWCSANANSFNNALPTAAKSNLTTRQKARLLSYVVRRRYEVS